MKGADLVRDYQLRVCITATEREVLELLAEQWDVPTATAAYGLLADSIARCRRSRAVLTMPDKLIYAASRIVAKYQPEHPESQENVT
jgi:hypothetical protein